MIKYYTTYLHLPQFVVFKQIQKIQTVQNSKHAHLRAVFSTGRVGGLNYKTYTSSLSYTDVFQIFATLAADLSDLHPGKFSLTPDDLLLAPIC